jgi:uncharacterized protein (DUF427 family)
LIMPLAATGEASNFTGQRKGEIMAGAEAGVQISIRPASGPRTVRAGGAVVVRSARALELREGAYPPVLYFPREDAAMDLLERTDRQTTCPHKGQASYYSIVTPAGRVENAVWSYETPKQHVGAIAGYLAFYPDRVSVSED